MRKLALLCLALALSFAGRGAALAEGLEVNPEVGGMTMACMDFRGVVVRTTLMTDLGDVGRAWYIQRMPVIALDPDRLRTLPPKLQIFFYGHECAHHVLGHYFNHTMSSEQEADCWSIRSGRQHGVFSREDVVAFAPYFAESKGSPFGHLPGPERAAYLLTCFDHPEDAPDQLQAFNH